MGGHLTVSSVEHHGSTFTFVLPYKVSSISDSSDDPDELSDMDPRGILGDGNDDDLHTGVFVFQPRTLGSLFSPQNSGRIKKLTPSGYGFKASRKCNGLLEDISSPTSSITVEKAINAAEESEDSAAGPVQTSFRQEGSSDANECPIVVPTSSSSSSNGPETSASASAAPQTCQRQANLDGSSTSDCSTSNSLEIPKVETKNPKILLVEDNKINVMVTKSMMKQLGHNIEVVSNGADAVRTIQQGSYDLVLMV